jgi:hypothetical protein
MREVPRYIRTYRVFLLLDLNGRAVLEGPLDHIGLIRGSLHELALLEGRPELAEVLELDQVPDIAEGGLDDSRFADGGGGGDASRHCGFYGAIGFVDMGGVVLVLLEKQK